MPENGTINLVAVPLGTAGNGIEVTVPSPGPNQSLSVAAVGTVITVTPQTDGLGNVLTLCSALVALMNSTPAVAALITSSLIVDGSVPIVTAFLAGGGGGVTPVGVDRAIGIKIKDWTGKYFMNDYVPLDLIFGFDNSQTPGLVYPEIYIPKNQLLFLDLLGFEAVSPQIVALTFKGEKVYNT